MNIQINNYNTSFNGFLPAKKRVFSQSSLTRMADMLNLKRNDVYTHTRQMNQKQYDFFEALTERYNGMYFYSKEKEDPKNLFKLAEAIKEPQKWHLKMIDYVSGSFENLSKVMTAVTNKSDYKFVKNFEKEVFENKQHSENILPDILLSKNKKEYIEHIDNYKSYLRLNRDNSDAIKELDKMLEEGTYDGAVYDKEINLKSLDNVIVDLLISKEDLDRYYSKEGKKFIHRFVKEYLIPANFSDAARKDVLEMYKTCSKDNIDIRKDIMSAFKSSIFYSKDFNKEINAMRSIFDKIDSNEHTYKLVEDFTDNFKSKESLTSLNEVLENVSPQKAYIFRKNLYRIIQITKPGEERISALQNELENPFFETSISKYQQRMQKDAQKNGFLAQNGKFHNLLIRVENYFNKLKYSYLSKKEAVSTKPETKIEEEVKSALNDLKPETLTAVQEPAKADFIEIPKFEQEITAPTEENLGIKLVNTVMTKAQKKKIEAQESVKEFIHKKLHPSIVNKQEHLYTNKATKMRLRMLPEILASIKDTRSAMRANGIKRPKISNSDAIDLYSRIDGRNKKLVNYMLKKRSADGNRMFSVNDIIDELGKTHKRIILEHLKPAQARELYEEAYQTKLNEFGELKPVKRK